MTVTIIVENKKVQLEKISGSLLSKFREGFKW